MNPYLYLKMNKSINGKENAPLPWLHIQLLALSFSLEILCSILKYLPLKFCCRILENQQKKIHLALLSGSSLLSLQWVLALLLQLYKVVGEP